MKIKLGVSPINWCNDDDPTLGADISFGQMIREMAEAGYAGTEIGSKYPDDASELKSFLSPFGLEISSAWFSTYFTEPENYQTTLSRFLKHMSLMRALGARTINVCECGHAIQNKNLPILSEHKPVFSEVQWENLIQGLHQIGRIAYDFGLQIVYHYHAGTGVFTEEEINFLMQHTSPTLISLLLDTGHAAFAGIDSIQLIHHYKNRIRYVHLKDIRQSVLTRVAEQQLNFMDAVRAGVFTVPGDGDLDFMAIMQALKKINYQGWLLVEAEQDPKKAPPLAYAKKAYQYLSALIPGIL